MKYLILFVIIAYHSEGLANESNLTWESVTEEGLVQSNELSRFWEDRKQGLIKIQSNIVAEHENLALVLRDVIGLKSVTLDRDTVYSNPHFKSQPSVFRSMVIPLSKGNQTLELSFFCDDIDLRCFTSHAEIKDKGEATLEKYNSGRLHLALLATLIFIGLYHLTLFAINGNDQPSLFLGLLCLVSGVRESTFGLDPPYHVLSGDFSFSSFIFLNLASSSFLAPIFYLYAYSLFPKHLSKLFAKAIFLAYVPTCIFILAANASDKFYGSIIHYVLVVITISVGLTQLYKAVRDKERLSTMFFSSIGIYSLLNLFDIFFVAVKNAVLSISSLATLAFIFVQACLVALRNQQNFRRLVKERQENARIYGELDKLVLSHQIEEIRSGKTIEETMQCGKKKVGVIELDIIRSTELTQRYGSDLCKSILDNWRESVLAQYDKNSGSCPGYIAKEVGDGMLISVGFPLTLPVSSTHSIEEASIRLALELISSFQSFRSRNFPNVDVFCSAVVVHDYVEGYYTEGVFRRYEMFGHGLVLASRYGSVRSMIFKDLESNVIMVHNSLKPTLDQLGMLKGFEFYTLNELEIRNDRSATGFFYMLIGKSLPKATSSQKLVEAS